MERGIFISLFSVKRHHWNSRGGVLASSRISYNSFANCRVMKSVFCLAATLLLSSCECDYTEAQADQKLKMYDMESCRNKERNVQGKQLLVQPH